MKATRLNQKGFEPIVIVVLVLIVAGVGLAAFRINSANKPKATTTATVNNTKPQVKSKSDVTNAKNAVNNIAIDNDLNPSQLDKDLSSLQ